jgi:putative membrane protein
MRLLSWVAVAAIPLILSGCSTPGGVGTGGAGANLSNDEFVRDVAVKNMAAIELSRMALDKATDPDIRFFAHRVIDDHAAAGHTLKSVLAGRPIEWPAQLDDKHRETADELVK